MSEQKLAARLDVVRPSATVAIAQRATELRARGVDVISFGVGEPDFETPEHIRAAARVAVDRGSSHYTAVRGTAELRKAICADSLRRRGREHSLDEVVVSVGAKHALFNLALALFEPGDEVIIPAPYWVSYPEQVRLAGATPVVVETKAEQGYRLTPSLLAAALGSATKALIICTPCNPTGAAYGASHLCELADVVRRHSCWIIVDEIYADLVYDGFEHHSLLEVAPDLRERLIVVDGVSKTYAMTGWRIGWALAPKRVAKACDTIQSQATTSPTAVAQHAALAALTGAREPIEAMRRVFEERRNIIVQGLNDTPGISCRMPEGAFYAFADVRGLYGKRSGMGTGTEKVLADDVIVAEWLLDEARCAVVPGAAFGAAGHVRFSYATSNALIEEGLHRIRAAVAALG